MVGRTRLRDRQPQHDRRHRDAARNRGHDDPRAPRGTGMDGCRRQHVGQNARREGQPGGRMARELGALRIRGEFTAPGLCTRGRAQRWSRLRERSPHEAPDVVSRKAILATGSPSHRTRARWQGGGHAANRPRSSGRELWPARRVCPRPRQERPRSFGSAPVAMEPHGPANALHRRGVGRLGIRDHRPDAARPSTRLGDRHFPAHGRDPAQWHRQRR